MYQGNEDVNIIFVYSCPMSMYRKNTSCGSFENCTLSISIIYCFVLGQYNVGSELVLWLCDLLLVNIVHWNLILTLILGAKRNERYNEMHLLNGMQHIVIEW